MKEGEIGGVCDMSGVEGNVKAGGKYSNHWGFEVCG